MTFGPSSDPVPEDKGTAGAQTLMRGLDVLDAIVDGPLNLVELSDQIGLSKSTTHRLAAALIERRFISFRAREGYALGPKLLELGGAAKQQVQLSRVARPILEALSRETQDSVHLGVRQEDHALYLDKVSGSRRVAIQSSIGERQPLITTGLGKALLLDLDDAALRELYSASAGGDGTGLALWLERIRLYAERGYAFDLEENEHQIRCVAAPVRDVDGNIVAAVSISGAAQYMNDARLRALAPLVHGACRDISEELGWRLKDPEEGRRPPS